MAVMLRTVGVPTRNVTGFIGGSYNRFGKFYAVRQGDAIGAVESVKSAADINAPISCKITAVNAALEEKPGAINQVPEDDSHGGGWIARVDVDEQGVKDLAALMDAEEYKSFTATEEDKH